MALRVLSSALTETPDVPQATPDVVVARLMSFDRNKDGLVTADELSERMQGVMARGDRGGDGALDADEVRRLAVAPQPVQVQGFGDPVSSGYGFGDESGFNTRMHIEGAINDLRLASGRRDAAQVIGAAFAERREKASLAELRETMAPLLSEEELKVFTLLATQSAQTTAFRVVRGPAGEKDAVNLQFVVSQMQRFLPNAKQPPEATEAIKRFKERQQLSEPDRQQLLAELTDVLSPQERDDLNAALARRPVVKRADATRLLERTRDQFTIAVTH
jgi:hypothetical protein